MITIILRNKEPKDLTTKQTNLSFDLVFLSLLLRYSFGLFIFLLCDSNFIFNFLGQLLLLTSLLWSIFRGSQTGYRLQNIKCRTCTSFGWQVIHWHKNIPVCVPFRKIVWYCLCIQIILSPTQNQSKDARETAYCNQSI